MRTGTDSGTWCTLPQITAKGNGWQRTTIPFKYWVVFCVLLQCILVLKKLTIAGQPIGCSPCQRPTPLPGCSAGKHRCSRRLRWEMLQLQHTLDHSDWMPCEGAEFCPLLRNVGYSLLIEWWVVRAGGPWWRRRRSVFNTLETSVLFWFFFIARNVSQERNRQAGQVRWHSDWDGESWLLCIC